MPRNFSELKSGGGTLPMLSTHAEKWGTRPPPRHPPIDARAADKGLVGRNVRHFSTNNKYICFKL